MTQFDFNKVAKQNLVISLLDTFAYLVTVLFRFFCFENDAC